MSALEDQLPNEPLLLTASAGTGKTYQLTAWAVRYLAEREIGIEQLLILTFSTQATAELRQRILAKIQQVTSELNAFEAGQGTPTDPLAKLLSEPLEELIPRINRLQTAAANYEDATISTIHSFCKTCLRELGVLGDWDAAETIAADPIELINQCAADVYLQRYHDQPAPRLKPNRAFTIARAACSSTSELLGQEEAVSYAKLVRERFENEKRRLGLAAFDDLAPRLRQLLAHNTLGPLIAETLRERYRVVLVDEFQDTDVDQWQILLSAFITANHPVILIGDPKQAIYGFRNAELDCYQQAKKQLPSKSLSHNYRSTAEVVAGVSALFGNIELGEEISLSEVTAVANGTLELPGPAQRVWIKSANSASENNPIAQITSDVVGQVLALLSQAKLAGSPVSPADIAILVRTHARGSELLAALSEAGVPARLTGQGKLLSTRAAQDWRLLFKVLADQTTSQAVLAGLSDLLGFAVSELLNPKASKRALLNKLLHDWREAFVAGGPAQLVGNVLCNPMLVDRVTSLPDSDQYLSDVRAVGELVAESGATTLNALSNWLQTAVGVDSQQRVATEEPQVRICTIHSAKGLQFPIVLLPQVSTVEANLKLPFPLRGPDGVRRLCLDQLRRGSRIAEEFIRQAREEELRLLYVGFTRAEQLVIAWHYLDRKQTAEGPLTALLARDRTTPKPADRYLDVPAFEGRFPAEHIYFAPTQKWQPSSYCPPAKPKSELVLPEFTRRIDLDWRRTSYSGLVSGIPHFEAVNDEVETTLIQGASSDDGPESPMSGLPAGANFGSLVHEILENLDWAQLPGSVQQLVGKLGPDFGLQTDQLPQLSKALELVCTTNLHRLTDGECLAQLPRSATLNELDFDLPLGDQGPPATIAKLAELLERQLAPDDPLASYPKLLAASEAAPEVLSGFLTGSIDLVFQNRADRFVVVDYKTNRLSPDPEAPLLLSHYRPNALAAAMMHAHYPLQAILYCAALHRYLTWRLPGYSPQRHLGGVGYLFVRGMAGPSTPVLGGQASGVFEWYPSPDLVVAVSNLLGGQHD